MDQSEPRGSESRQSLYAFMRGLAYGPSTQTLAGSIVIQILVLASGVVAARALGAEDRGHLALLWLIPTSLALIGGLGLPQATTYYVAKDVENAATVSHISVMVAAIQTVALIALYGIILLVFVSPNESEVLISGIVTSLSIPALLFQAIGLGVLQGRQQFRPFNVVRILPAAFYAVAATVLLVCGWDSLLTFTVAVVVAWGGGALLTWAVVLRTLRPAPRPPTATINEIVRFGIRGVFGSVSPVDDLRVDQLMVGFVVDVRALGLYVAAVSFCNLPRFIAQSIGLVSYPRIASAKDRTEAWEILKRSLRIGTALIVVTVAGLIAIVPFAIPFFFGAEFEDAVGLSQLLLVGALFLSMRRLFTEYSRGLGHPGYGSLGELLSLALLVPAVALLVPSHHESGIAVAVIIASAISAAALGGLLFRLRLRHPPESRSI